VLMLISLSAVALALTLRKVDRGAPSMSAIEHDPSSMSASAPFADSHRASPESGKVPKSDIAPMLRHRHFVSIADFGLVGPSGENDKVSHVLKPVGRSCPANSP